MFKRMLVLSAACVMLFVVLCGCTSQEKKAAIQSYNDAVAALEAKNTQLDAHIEAAQALVTAAEPALDVSTLSALERAVSAAKEGKVPVPDAMPETVEEILAVTRDTLGAVDYSEAETALSDAKTAYETSVRQLQQLTNPEETFVIERLQKVEGVTGVEAVTEENDPNGMLGKQGGYTAQVYFTFDQVNAASVNGKSIIEKGTDGGGSLEVYETAAEAEARNTYLGSFDGTMFASGSHHVYGTVLVRTSNLLTASQQKALEDRIVESLAAIAD